MNQTMEEYLRSLDTLATVEADRVDTLIKGKAVIINQIEANFAGRQTATGQAWAPHAPSTIARYGAHPLLELSGAMKDAATGGPGRREEIINGDILALGVSPEQIEYAGFHETGTAKMPARPFMNLNNDTADKLAELSADDEVARIERT